MTDEQALEKLLARLEPNDDGCWVWSGATTKSGYGHMRLGEQHPRVHRLAYQLLVGLIPEGHELDHLCHNRLCANPAHLEPVTKEENVRRTKGHLAPDHATNEAAFESEAWLAAYITLRERSDPDPDLDE